MVVQFIRVFHPHVLVVDVSMSVAERRLIISFTKVVQLTLHLTCSLASLVCMFIFLAPRLFFHLFSPRIAIFMLRLDGV